MQTASRNVGTLNAAFDSEDEIIHFHQEDELIALKLHWGHIETNL